MMKRFRFDPMEKHAEVIARITGEVLEWNPSTWKFLLDNQAPVNLTMTEENANRVKRRLEELGIESSMFKEE